MRRPPLLLLLAVLAAAAVVAGCGSSSGSDGDGAGRQRVRIALDFTANVNYLGLYAAIRNGDFAREGIDPEVLPYAGTPAETLVRAGRTDLGISYPPEVIAQRAAGLRYKAVAALVARNTTALAVDASSPYVRPAQLSGRTYGGFGVASDRPIIEELLRRDGVAEPRFRQVTLNSDAYVALARGRIDYSSVFAGIDDVTAAAQGTRLRLFPYARYLGAAGRFPNAVYVASEQTIAAKGDALRRALAALRSGYEWSARHPQEAARILVDANRTALGASARLVEREAALVAPSFVRGGRWGALSAADFTGLESILVRGGVVRGTPPAPADLVDASLLAGSRR